MRWHFLVTPPDDGAGNMARDEALMRWSARTGHAAFRVYAWSRPTLSLGRNQRARGCYNLALAAERGIGIVRRPTGGRALLHHREITYSATLPAHTPAEASRAYESINAILLAALDQMGVGAGMASGAGAIEPGLRPCFDAPARHEIVVGGRKLVGSAQWRHGGALVQHGSILIRDHQHWINELLLDPASAGTPAAATLHAALGREPSVEECATALRSALSHAAAVDDFDDTESLDTLLADLRPTYRDDSWTWRR